MNWVERNQTQHQASTFVDHFYGNVYVFADGDWGLFGGVIAALGIHGLVTIRGFQEINYPK
ncbi:hypothetical protein LC653_05315 [Nostoc sp. CHAB 5784]|uniref:hypothetical protein n=1 Tax=Nostoc mirabile TaxID=2907820 RepID=UPI001E5659CF|nr:hypothetical protein [Nostoc mirabile]MCC5663367.1 hypothetical protein [Nostoc mirabile CHAB5784]